MTETLDTKLKILSWDEKPYRELPDGSKFARAEVALAGDVLTSGTFEALLHYRPDGTSTYVALMQLSGTLDGRTGDFVLRGEGHYDGTTARGEMTVIPGSGTGGFAGIAGRGESVSTHADYPYMPLVLSYDLG
jgi:hypothetical protein